MMNIIKFIACLQLHNVYKRISVTLQVFIVCLFLSNFSIISAQSSMKLGQDTPNLTTNDGNSTGMDASKDISPKVMNLGTIATFPPPPIIQVGTGTATSASNTRTPWTTFFEDTRHQYLITAAELAALGLTNGDQLYALAFNVIAVASPNSNVTIRNNFV